MLRAWARRRRMRHSAQADLELNLVSGPVMRTDAHPMKFGLRSAEISDGVTGDSSVARKTEPPSASNEAASWKRLSDSRRASCFRSHTFVPNKQNGVHDLNQYHVMSVSCHV